jgi:hypothetical protein
LNLKVVTFKNYGCTDFSVPSENIYENNFYWSFYRLNNGKIIDLHFVENLTNGKLSSVDYFFGYAKSELKTGEIRTYKFGNAEPNTKEMSKEFFDWFDANPPAKDCKKLIYPNKDEEKCVKEFFDKNILKTKEIQTNIINL